MKFILFKINFIFASKIKWFKSTLMKNAQLYDVNKMRNYSAVFSSTHFSNLLKKNDYSFLNSRVDFYKENKKTNLVTYFDYIRYVYSHLQKNYRNEYVYKNTLINEILIKKYGLKETIAINEFRVGNSIADIVLFNGTSKAFEIKTELDSEKRLKGQLNDYTKIFKQCYVVTAENLMDKYLKVDTNIGLIVLYNEKRSLKMKEIRPARTNEHIDAETLIKTVRTSEYKAIVKEFYGELPKMNDFNMFEICADLIKAIPNEDLHRLFIKALKRRQSNTNKLQSYNRELRQLALAMNLTPKNYKQLLEKLNQPIQY